jgi:hypothetical protein
VTPFCVHGQKFAGCIYGYMIEEDGFSETDRILLQDVASMLGSSIYNKRLKFAADCSNEVSREILHSMIPPRVSKFQGMSVYNMHITIIL